MAIENNLPVILDVATQSEDGLMSYQDKIKLDRMGENLDNKLSKDDKISASQLDISSDEVKIQPENLSAAVKEMMTGNADVYASVTKNSVTREHIVDNSITISELDKRIFLANIVSPRPLNFAFDTKSVNINIPKGTLLLLDAITSRKLALGSDIEDQNINISYPEKDFEGLNYIVSHSEDTNLQMINYKNANTIPSTSSIVALINLTKSYEATVIMNGNYTVNGLANGVGTESAALLGIGKIVLDAHAGVIDFTDAKTLHLIIGGIFNKLIENQVSIRLADYSDDAIYTLYWDGATSSLKAEANAIGTTDISKIALIKDGRIIPFVDTGIYYSKPYADAPYFTEELPTLNDILVVSDSAINFRFKNESKIDIPKNTFVLIKDKMIQIKNQECYYGVEEGLHYILFNLDTHEVSSRYHKETPTEDRLIVIGGIWVGDGYIYPYGSFKYVIDGNEAYSEDLNAMESAISNIENIITNDISDNKILAGDVVYMVDGEELPVYTTSMLNSTAEGIKPAIMYNKNNNELAPRISYFDNEVFLNGSMGDKVSLLAYDKYDSKSYLRKDIDIMRTSADSKMGHTIRVLCLGDELVDEFSYHLHNKLESFGVNCEMVGTMASQVNGEGRKGWFYSTFLGASGRGLEEGMVHPQASSDKSSIYLNPFVRVANADDKANNPNACYRSTGDYIEKNYFTDNNTDGTFYIFDFMNYMEVQGIDTPSVVVIALKPESVSRFTGDVVGVNMLYMKQLISGIRSALPSSNIVIIPQYGSCTRYDDMWTKSAEIIEETVKYVNSLEDSKIHVLSSWLHMNREFGTEYVKDGDQLYKEEIHDQLKNKLSDTAKIELANSIAAYIMNI